jgi:ABC-2 type transport system permease protein
MATTDYLPTGQRHFGLVNWLGLWTLYCKEVQRFLKVGIQTVLAPVVSTLLFLIIFKLALGRVRPDINGVPFANFLAPGLIMMAILTNALANTSSSILMAKIQGNLVDVLMPPLAPWELAIGYVMGGVTRGLIVASTTGLAMLAFIDLSIAHVWATIYYALIASLLLSEIGVLAGIWAEKFDHMAVITNFVVMPLVFLSGTFYSVRQLPDLFVTFSHWNPFFYLIDGFRYGVVGHADGSIATGAIGLFVLTFTLGWGCYTAFRTGWNLKT